MSYFRKFCYLKSSCIRKSITLMFMRLEELILAFVAKVGNRCFCWFPSAMLELIQASRPAWRLHTNLYKFGKNISSDISYTKYSSDLNLGEGHCICTSFHFPDSGLYLSNGFYFCFDLFWMAWHWKPAILVMNVCRSSPQITTNQITIKTNHVIRFGGK